MLKTAVNRHGQRIISFKDDTFTANKSRVLAICEGIRKQQLEFIWSCDTRADYLDDELLYEMRRAGCIRISVGVESASNIILKNIKKKAVSGQAFRCDSGSKKVRHANPILYDGGESGRNSGDISTDMYYINRAKPNQFVFSQLHLYPGTEEI